MEGATRSEIGRAKGLWHEESAILSRVLALILTKVVLLYNPDSQ